MSSRQTQRWFQQHSLICSRCVNDDFYYDAMQVNEYNMEIGKKKCISRVSIRMAQKWYERALLDM